MKKDEDKILASSSEYLQKPFDPSENTVCCDMKVYINKLIEGEGGTQG